MRVQWFAAVESTNVLRATRGAPMVPFATNRLTLTVSKEGCPSSICGKKPLLLVLVHQSNV
jgi:hypothetical protein